MKMHLNLMSGISIKGCLAGKLLIMYLLEKCHISVHDSCQALIANAHDLVNVQEEGA